MKKMLNGFVMIEVLISLGVVALVFLSLLSYQLSLLKNTERFNFQAIAQLQLMNFAEMLRLNANSDERNKSLLLWNHDNKRLLPEGRGSFVLKDNHQCHLSLDWVYRKKQSESIDVFC